MDISLGVSWRLASSSTFTNTITITNHHLFAKLRRFHLTSTSSSCIISLAQGRFRSSPLLVTSIFLFLPFFPHIMSPLFNMRRFSRSNSIHNREAPQSPPTSFTPPLTHAPMLPNGTAGSHQDSSHSRPVSVNTGSSFDFANRPPAQYQMTSLPSSSIGNLSRTDQIVLRHFWEVKNEENKARDLHFVSSRSELNTT